jgi:hypothetical protein
LDGYYLLVLLDKPDTGCVNVKYDPLFASGDAEVTKAGDLHEFTPLHINYDRSESAIGYHNANRASFSDF